MSSNLHSMLIELPEFEEVDYGNHKPIPDVVSHFDSMAVITTADFQDKEEISRSLALT